MLSVIAYTQKSLAVRPPFTLYITTNQHSVRVLIQNCVTWVSSEGLPGWGLPATWHLMNTILVPFPKSVKMCGAMHFICQINRLTTTKSIQLIWVD